MFVFCNFLKLLMVSDKHFTWLFEYIKLYEQNPLEIFFLHDLPNFGCKNEGEIVLVMLGY